MAQQLSSKQETELRKAFDGINWDEFFYQLAVVMSEALMIETRERMKERMKNYKLYEQKIAPDGNCQFGSFSHQLTGEEKHHALFRKAVCTWLRKNSNFELEKGSYIRDFLDNRFSSWEDYCNYMSQDKVWGDHITLIAMANLFGVRINILTSIKLPPGTNPMTVIEPKEVYQQKEVYLSHWHEAHYNSLLPLWIIILKSIAKYYANGFIE